MNVNSIIFLLLCIKLCITVLSAQVVIYPVSKVIFEYGNSHSSLPNLELLNKAYYSPKKDGKEFPVSTLTRGLSKPINLSDEGIFRLGELGIHFLKDQGFEGVVALPHPDYIDPISGEDLRSQGNEVIVIQLWVSILNKIDFKDEDLKQKEKLKLKDGIKTYTNSKDTLDQPIRAGLFNDLRQILNHPSRDAQVLLSATENPGRVNAVVKVNRKESDHYSLSVANAGSPSTGRWLLTANLNSNQLSGRDDRLTVGLMVSNTGERRGVTGNYYLPFLPQDKLGASFGLGYSSYDASTFALANPIEFEGESIYGDFSLIYKSSLAEGKFIPGAEIGLKLENVEAFNSLSNRHVDVAMLTPRISVFMEQRNKYRVGKTSLSLLGNLLSIDEQDMISLGGIDTTDRYAKILFSHYDTLFLGKLLGSSGKFLSRHSLSLNLQSSFALSGNRQLPQHQFITGGTGSVRGYPESPVAGDSGIFASLEYRFPFLFIPSAKGGDLAWTMAPFVDWARTSVNQPLFYESNHILLSTGLSFYLAFPYGIYANIEFAKPLREITVAGSAIDGTRSNDYRIHGNIGWKF